MSNLYNIAHLLVSSWALSNPENAGKKIPTSNGLLDRALRIAVNRRSLPEWVSDGLNFVDSRMGLQCVELPEILDWAQRAKLTSTPNPSYQYTEVNVSPLVARTLIRRLGISEPEAKAVGHALREALADAVKESRNVDSALVA